MGIAYLARNAIPGLEDMQAVLKFPAIPANEDKEYFMRRWLHEVKGLLAIDHPNVVKIHDAQIYQGMPYIRMEYAKGTALSWLIAFGAIPEPHLVNCMSIAKGILSALTDIHSRGISHRDIKPQNIIINPDLKPKLIDFGIVKLQTEDLTRCGEFFGTIGYMSPEVLDEIEDPRRDVWAAGMVLYSMLTYYEPKRDPNVGKGEFEKMEYFRQWRPQPLPKKFGEHAAHIDDLLEEMLDPNYERRIHAKEAHERVCAILPRLDANAKTAPIRMNLGTLEQFINDAKHMGEIEFIERYGTIILVRADTHQNATRSPIEASRWIDQSLETIIFTPSKKQSYIIGRNPESDFRVNHQYVSNQHAAILKKDSHYFIRDLSSKNGTRVRDLPKIAAPIQLRPGDAILFGHPAVQYVFETALSIRAKLRSAQDTDSVLSDKTKTSRRIIAPGTTKQSPGQTAQSDSA